MVYLVGVDRQLQHNGSRPPMSAVRSDAIERFSKFLVSTSAELKISLFAEEFNEEQLIHAEGSRATVRDVAHRLGAKHRFCDPLWIQRRHLRLQLDDRREEFWLWYLGDYLYSETILFVCGQQHLQQVYTKLQAKGVRTAILPERWGTALQYAEPVASRERPSDQRPRDHRRAT
jgi:hypothetical protein